MTGAHIAFSKSGIGLGKSRNRKRPKELSMKIAMRHPIKLLLCLLFSVCLSGVLSAEIVYINYKSGKNQTARMLEVGEETITIQPIEGGPPEIVQKSDIKLFTYYAGEDGQGVAKQEAGWTLYLRNGEVIEGNVTQFTSEFVTIESLSGNGVLQLPASEIDLIASKKAGVILNQRQGIGYSQHKSTLNSTDRSFSYNSDQLSYKFFMSDDVFGNFLFAFGDASFGDKKLQIVSVDYKMGAIFKRVQNSVLYFAASGGYMKVKDTANDIEDLGYTARAMIGMEMFFRTMPNFGFAGEVGIGHKKVGSYKETDLSTSNFPTFSIHYYF